MVMMFPRAGSYAGVLKAFRRLSIELAGRDEHGMMRARALGPGRVEHQQPRELGRYLAEILEVLAAFENVGSSVVVSSTGIPAWVWFFRPYRNTKGLGLFPEMSIHTLFVCKYSRIASDPLSLPIPDRLYPPNGDM